MATLSVVDKFHASYVKQNDSGCWEWVRAKNQKGYGMFGRNNLAHRWSYQNFVSDIPKGLYVCHSCDNRSCVNPSHLWAGTQKQNMDDMMAKGRGNWYRGPRPWVSRPGDLNPSRVYKDRMPRGERVNTAIFTADDIRQIRATPEPINKSELARKYGTSATNIRHILNRKSWAHID